MAAESPVKGLQEEATCPVCLDYFRDPVTLECGHNFCQACISQCWEGPGPAAPCLQCGDPVQQGAFRTNRQLANVVELVKRPSLQAVQDTGGAGVCREHREALKLFCEEDQVPICVICRVPGVPRSQDAPHRRGCPRVQGQISSPFMTLREEREKLLGWKAMGEGKSQEYLKQTQAERQKIVAEFQQLQQFLEEQERHLPAQLEKLNEEIARLQADTVRKLSAQISRLSELIGELEGMCQKPVSEFLQDVRSNLSRSEKERFQQPVEISPELKNKLHGVSQKTVALMQILRKFKVNVTLDPDTAHPQLFLSEDRKSVRWTRTRQQLPNNPERFENDACVLGCERFTSGRLCWEVDVEYGIHWDVGVAKESVSRKGGIILSPKDGIWAVHGGGGSVPGSHCLPRSTPNRIWVCLDCDRGQVTFIDADDEAPIFTFLPGSLPRERI